MDKLEFKYNQRVTVSDEFYDNLEGVVVAFRKISKKDTESWIFNEPPRIRKDGMIHLYRVRLDDGAVIPLERTGWLGERCIDAKEKDNG